jgi:copper chaperone CopZ
MSLSSLFVVSNALRIAKRKKNQPQNIVCECDLTTIVLSVEGMHCGHCVEKVKSALEGVRGVYFADVNLDKKTATLKVNSEVAEQDIKTVILNAGFNVIEIKK